VSQAPVTCWVFELADQAVEIGAVLVEIDALAVGGAVVKGREEVAEGGELLEKRLRLALVDALLTKVLRGVPEVYSSTRMLLSHAFVPKGPTT
jgi:hypothetical protein